MPTTSVLKPETAWSLPTTRDSSGDEPLATRTLWIYGFTWLSLAINVFLRVS